MWKICLEQKINQKVCEKKSVGLMVAWAREAPPVGLGMNVGDLFANRCVFSSLLCDLFLNWPPISISNDMHEKSNATYCSNWFCSLIALSVWGLGAVLPKPQKLYGTLFEAELNILLVCMIQRMGLNLSMLCSV